MGDNQVSYMICLFLVHLLYHLGQLPRCFFFISQFQRKPCSFLGFHPFPCAHGDAGSPRWMEAPAEHGNGGESTWFPVDFPLNQWIGWYSTSNGFPLLTCGCQKVPMENQHVWIFASSQFSHWQHVHIFDQLVLHYARPGRIPVERLPVAYLSMQSHVQAYPYPQKKKTHIQSQRHLPKPLC